MYTNVKTWNPFKGCLFNCTYCKPSFQAQAKRQKHKCQWCYEFVPHIHPERLEKFPSAKKIFVAGNGDICFCSEKFTREIIKVISNKKYKDKVFYFQSKRPQYFEKFLDILPENVVLITTLETNRIENYENISKAPNPVQRYSQFLKLDFPNKVITIEPIVDFDHDEFLSMILNINPDYVWIGLNTKPKQVHLPEPSKEKFDRFYNSLLEHDINVKYQTIREDYL